MHRPTTLKLKPYPSRPISSARHASNPQPTFSHLPAETPPTQCPPAAASTFSSSMEIAVTLLEENAVTGERLKCCHAYLTFVALKSLKKADNPNPKVGRPMQHMYQCSI